MDFRTWLENEDDYRGLHTAPGTDDSPLYDLTGTYPEDIYGPNAARYYGHTGGGSPMDNATIAIIQQARNRPNMKVKIYRAVPAILNTQEKINDLEKQKRYIMQYGRIPRSIHTILNNSKYYELISDELEKLKSLPPDIKRIAINRGDWVTINRAYAVQHGRGHLVGKYRILTKTVPAKTLYTNGDSIHEWGYWP